MVRELRRPVRIAGASGGFSDRVHAISRIARNEEVDVIVGDWLSEMTMTMHGAGKIRNLAAGAGRELSFEEQIQSAMFAENFLDCFKPAVDDLARRGIKLVVNAGASDTELLAKLVKQIVNEHGYDLKVAWIEGDDATDVVKKMIEQGEQFRSLVHNKSIIESGLDLICGQAYMGGLGIAQALAEGSQIVICGRVSDASPVIGAAA